ncbi:hypothetical protein J2X69_002388 [Algoriphagus sp. 4150]|nr:hypothetical protein [Algoriphagus sp. 4150]
MKAEKGADLRRFLLSTSVELSYLEGARIY